MGVTIKTLRAEFDATTKALTRKIRGVKGAFQKLRGGLAKVAAKMRQALKPVALGIAALGAAAAASLAVMVSKAAKAGDKLQKMAARTGVSVEKLSELDFAAGRSGTSIEALETGIKRMQKAASDADRGLAESQRAFEDLGVAVTDENGALRDTTDLLSDVLAGLARIPNTAKRAALAQEVLGRAGTQMLPMLSEGVEGLEGLYKKAHELGATWSKEEADRAAAYTDAMGDIKSALGGVVKEIALNFMPSLTDAANGFASWIAANKDFIVDRIAGAYTTALDGVKKLASWWRTNGSGVISGMKMAFAGLAGFVTAMANGFKAVRLILEDIGLLAPKIGTLDFPLPEDAQLRALDARAHALREQSARAMGALPRFEKALRESEARGAGRSVFVPGASGLSRIYTQAEAREMIAAFKGLQEKLRPELEAVTKKFQARMEELAQAAKDATDTLTGLAKFQEFLTGRAKAAPVSAKPSGLLAAMQNFQGFLTARALGTELVGSIAEGFEGWMRERLAGTERVGFRLDVTEGLRAAGDRHMEAADRQFDAAQIFAEAIEDDEGRGIGRWPAGMFAAFSRAMAQRPAFDWSRAILPRSDMTYRARRASEVSGLTA